MNNIDFDKYMHVVCSKCSRHSISPDAKKQCPYLAKMCAWGKGVYIDKNGDCERFKDKKKQKKKVKPINIYGLWG